MHTYVSSETIDLCIGVRSDYLREIGGNSQTHLKGAQRKGAYSQVLASTLSLRAVRPATVLSHKCDILSLLKDE